MRRNFIFVLVLVGYVLPLHSKANATEVVSLDAPIQFYLVDQVVSGKNEKNSFSSKTKNLFLKALRVSGFHILYDLEPPLVSKAMERYGLIHTGVVQSSGIGYVHLLLTDDGVVHYVSDSDQEVVLKFNPQSIVWIFEKKKALEMADKAGAKYAFVVEVTTQLVYQNDSPKPVYNVSLNANLYQADNGKVVFHHEESMVKLAATAEDAVLGACQFLSQKLVEEMQEGEKTDSGK
jgi:hypothetical protein